jgi:hypothetical protein
MMESFELGRYEYYPILYDTKNPYRIHKPSQLGFVVNYTNLVPSIINLIFTVLCATIC